MFHPISFNPHTLLSKPPTHQPTTNLYSRTITFNLPNLHNQPTSKLSQHLSSSSSTQPGGACFPKNHLKIDTHPGPSLKLTSYTEKNNYQVSSPKNGYKNRGVKLPSPKTNSQIGSFPLKMDVVTSWNTFFLSLPFGVSHPIFRLVGAFNPFEKYARQIGNLPQISGWKFQKIFELPPPSSCFGPCSFRGETHRENHQLKKCKVPLWYGNVGHHRRWHHNCLRFFFGRS